ncbi:hypothetical protein BGZ76_010536 [Entomortierella beljakovae]|nr:hypothetical protein BGZ76_010536 [Entomortierella beljakovae]
MTAPVFPTFSMSTPSQSSPIYSSPSPATTTTTSSFSPPTCQIGTVSDKILLSFGPMDHPKRLNSEVGEYSSQNANVLDSNQAEISFQFSQPMSKTDNLGKNSTLEAQGLQFQFDTLHCLGEMSKAYSHEVVSNENVHPLPCSIELPGFQVNNSPANQDSCRRSFSCQNTRSYYTNDHIKKEELDTPASYQDHLGRSSEAFNLLEDPTVLTPSVSSACPTLRPIDGAFAPQGQRVSDTLSTMFAATSFNTTRSTKTPILASQPFSPRPPSPTSSHLLMGAPCRPIASQVSIASPESQRNYGFIPMPIVTSDLPSQFVLGCSVPDMNSPPCLSAGSSVSSLSSPGRSHYSSISNSPVMMDNSGHDESGMVSSSLYKSEPVEMSPEYGGNEIYASNDYNSNNDNNNNNNNYNNYYNNNSNDYNANDNENYYDFNNDPIGESPYVCQYPNCLRVFSRPFNLKSHLYTHKESRPYVCEKCPKSFVRIHDLHRHEKGHFEKAHTCIVCQSKFARQDAVTRHLKLAGGMNRCALILRHRHVSVKEAAAGRVRRNILGSEEVIRRMLIQIEPAVKSARATRKALNIARNRVPSEYRL